MTRRFSVLFLTDTLNAGGAERQLTELAIRLDRARFEPSVLFYASGDFYQARLEDEHVRVISLQRRSRFDFSPIWHLASMLRRSEVDLIHAFADVPNMYAALARRLAGRGKVIASVRSASDTSRSALQWRLKSWAHHTADLTISNNEAGLRLVAERSHLKPAQITCIRNGLDLDDFQPATADQRAAARAALGFSPDDLVFLSVGTLYWRKNYRGFIDALTQMNVPANWKFVWVGRSPDAALIDYLHQQSAQHGLQNNLVLLRKPTEEVRRLYHAADVLVSNSLSEGTPNVVIEAMACGLPIIATNVGDSSVLALNGSTGWLIPSQDAAALTAALCDASNLSAARRAEMGAAGRQRIIDLGMEMQSVVKSHEAVYLDLLTRQ